MARPKNMKSSLITLNSSFFDQLISVSPFTSLLSPRKSPRNHHHQHSILSVFFLCLLAFSTLLGFSILIFMSIYQGSSFPCNSLISPSSSPDPTLHMVSLSSIFSEKANDELSLERSEMVPLPAHRVAGNLSEEEGEFWKQPDGKGYRPCLDLSLDYRRASSKISQEKRRFLMVVVSGGLNQQRNQIIDAVVIARILEAALVVPVLQVNHIWGDDSEFGDLFDVNHFKKTLRADVRVVSSLPSTHLLSKQTVVNNIPHHVPPFWIRSRFFKRLNKDGVLVLKGLDSKLSKNLTPDLQKLRCKVAFHALRFAAPIQELGNRLARRMWIEGPYIAIHLRLEKDVWIRSGCLTGLGPKYDDIIRKDRENHPEYLTGRSNMSFSQRRLAGMCPLSALELARLLKALGAPKSARVYIAGGEPFGGDIALDPLQSEFPNLVTKEKLATEGELTPDLRRHSSVLAAIDYIVCLSSDVFLPSHGGNMGRALQGHRAYVGHRKFIKPNKRVMIPFFEDGSISDADFSRIMRKLHRKSQGRPELRTNKRDQDVVAHPVPECMCNS